MYFRIPAGPRSQRNGEDDATAMLRTPHQLRLPTKSLRLIAASTASLAPCATLPPSLRTLRLRQHLRLRNLRVWLQVSENDNGSKHVEACLHYEVLAHQRMARSEGADPDNRQ